MKESINKLDNNKSVSRYKSDSSRLYLARK